MSIFINIFIVIIIVLLCRDIRNRLLDTLFEISNGTNLASVRGVQILQVLNELTVAPNEIDQDGFEKLSALLNLVSFTLNLTADNTIPIQLIESATESMVGVMANLLSSGNCEYFQNVSRTLAAIDSIGQQGRVATEQVQAETFSFLSLLVRVSNEETDLVLIGENGPINVTIPQLNNEDELLDVAVTVFNDRLTQCLSDVGEVVDDPDVFICDDPIFASTNNDGTIISNVVNITVFDSTGVHIIGVITDSTFNFIIPILPSSIGEEECEDGQEAISSPQEQCQFFNTESDEW